MTERPFLQALQRFLVFLSALGGAAGWAQTGLTAPPGNATAAPRASVTARGVGPAVKATPQVCAACIRAHMNFLASDALRGRGSGTQDELLAAMYVSAQLEQYGIAPAGNNATYLQQVPVERQTLTSPPQLHFMTPGDGIPAQQILWTHGKEMLALTLSDSKFKGPLKRVDTNRGGPALQQTSFSGASFSRLAAQDATAGDSPRSVVLILGKDVNRIRNATNAAIESGAIAILAPASSDVLRNWDERGKELPKLPEKLEGSAGGPVLGGGGVNLFALSDDALASLNGIPDGTTIYFDGVVGPPQKGHTWNAVGKIYGADPQLSQSVILLSAHLDHLGVGPPVNGGAIYHGADDDASGTTAVLELARALGSGPRPKRTVVFALFGSEEEGGLGSSWFEAHPPVPLTDIAANLEFEMIGRRDPKYPDDSLWLSGWERSTLGPALAAHGAKVVADARPEEHFFMRSDNYVLAKKGVVAQTLSSFGLHADYHQPSDDLAHIDFRHVRIVIASLIGPVEWLVNSDFRPRWNPGGRP